MVLNDSYSRCAVPSVPGGVPAVPYEQCGSVGDDSRSIDIARILQPRTVTYARYRFSKVHSQMLVHIREELSAYVTKDFNEIDPSRLIRVPLFVSHYASFKGNLQQFYDCVAEFMQSSGNLVSFSWRFDAGQHAGLYRWMSLMGRRSRDASRVRLPEDGALFESRSFIIVNITRCSDDPGKLLVDINPVLLPFLLYYGVGNGGTYFSRDVALKFGSAYSFKIYELVMDWCTMGGVKRISLEDLRSLLVVPDGYDVSKLCRRVLDVARADLESAGSEVLFDYELKYDPEFGTARGTRGRLPCNCVVFTFRRRQSFDCAELSRKQLLVMLQEIADRQKAPLCGTLAAEAVRRGLDSRLKSKFYYYNRRVESGKMSPEEFRNTLLKVVREVTGVDLRSDDHIRNAMLSERRGRRARRTPAVELSETLF